MEDLRGIHITFGLMQQAKLHMRIRMFISACICVCMSVFLLSNVPAVKP